MCYVSSLLVNYQTGKTTAIRRIAVRESGISLDNHGAQIRTPPETSRTITGL